MFSKDNKFMAEVIFKKDVEISIPDSAVEYAQRMNMPDDSIKNLS